MQIRDPIHGFIEYDETEEKLINSDVFQRLRGIKQLAMASLVYPSANHTRFEHCIGTMHLAGIIAEKFYPQKSVDKKRKIIRLAGLLHDIGHGPFSHVSEDVMQNKISKKTLDDYQADGCHELMSILLIKHNEEIGKILSEARIDKNEIIKILQKQEGRNIEKDIVSGPLDADKIDYLLRDSHFAGVKYGVFDIEKLMESLTKVDREIGISYEGVPVLEQMLLAKYHMTIQVYRHRVRRITDAMIIRGIEYAIEEGIEEVKLLYEFEDNADFLDRFVKYDDRKVMDIILNKSSGIAMKYFERLKDRELFKEVFSSDIKSDFPDYFNRVKAQNLSKENIKNIIKKVKELFSSQDINLSFIIVDKQTTKNPTFWSPLVEINTEKIMVSKKIGKEKRNQPFTEFSTVFNNPNVDPETEMLYIYLPLDNIHSREDREKLINEKREEMLEIIKEEVRDGQN